MRLTTAFLLLSMRTSEQIDENWWQAAHKSKSLHKIDQ